MKNHFKVYLSLIFIPILVSLSWIIGGDLVKVMPTVTLTIARIAFSTVTLLIMLFLFNRKDLTNLQNRIIKLDWWKGQLILTLTGRVLYFILSTHALKSISPLQAILFNGLLPIFGLFLARISGQKFKNKLIPFFSFLTSLSAIAAIFNIFSGSWILNLGIIEMFFAVFFFSLHISLYKKYVSSKSATETLFSQFLLCFLILLPFDFDFINPLFQITIHDLIKFLIYSIVCNLAPFFLLHYTLKYIKPINIQLVCTLAPIFGLFFNFLYQKSQISNLFIYLTLLTVALISITIFLDFQSTKGSTNAS
ncbi:MAG: DMT family transporter [Bdellovibrionaceae bacterium]|nr:DMT family transporter [Pseudobdellovibrionaceae bacterium]NUM58524.1 DMT family transporter [Pseudobdellovibrionaceae bacterium]